MRTDRPTAGAFQFFPGILLGLFWNRATAAGVFAGMLVGVTSVAFLVLTGRDPFLGLNAGFLALCANFAVTVLVSFLARAPQPDRPRRC
jgi:solute:Na+ symporter, SSS family